MHSEFSIRWSFAPTHKGRRVRQQGRGGEGRGGEEFVIDEYTRSCTVQCSGVQYSGVVFLSGY